MDTQPTEQPQNHGNTGRATRSRHPDGARWYVVHTYSGHENKVSANLKQRIETQNLTHKIFDIVVPTRNIVTVKHGKKKSRRKNFPRLHFGKNGSR